MDKAVDAALTAVHMIMLGFPSSQGFIKLGPFMRKPLKSTHQSTLLEIGLSKSMAPSLNPPQTVTSGLRTIPIAK